jgi:hypothetical protein
MSALRSTWSGIRVSGAVPAGTALAFPTTSDRGVPHGARAVDSERTDCENTLDSLTR